jgi:hypothetical protein
MHTLTINLCAVLIALSSLAASAQQVTSGPDNRYKIALTVDGVVVRGSQELELEMEGKSKAEQELLQTAGIHLVNRGQTLQLIVSVTDPTGVTKIYPRGKRVAFDTFGCMKVGSGGSVIVTAKPSASACVDAGSIYRPLFVIFNDAAGMPLTYSEYIFKIRP